jgi:hypothetical protein
MKKNHYIVLLTLILTASLIFSFSGYLFSEFNEKVINADLNATDAPDHIVLTWSGDPTTTQTITWRAKSTVSHGSVRYKESDRPDTAYLIRNAEVETFTTWQGDIPGSMHIFSVMLTGLNPGTRYVYSVECGKNTSSKHFFSTAIKNIDTFEFLIFGDSQGRGMRNPDYTSWHDTVNNAFKLHARSKFIINMGDLVEVGQSYIHWNNWFDAAKDVISTIPEMPVVGNHDMYTMKRHTYTKPFYLTSQLKTFQNGPDRLKGQVYSFDYGTVHIAVLDSQQEEESLACGDILTAQKEWLNQDLAATRKKWKLVFMHKPPYFNNPMSMNKSVKMAFCPIFDHYHVDVVFSAHDHVIARTYPIKNDNYYHDPKDGTIYYITGRSGSNHYDFLSSAPWDELFYNPRKEPCYLSVKIETDKLSIIVYTRDGLIIDSYSIVK